MPYPADSARVFVQKVVATLPAADFFLTGQLHNNSANVLLEKELLIELNKKFNVTYYILEYSHATAFLINEYFETGNDSLLFFINPVASFEFIRSIKQHNDTVSHTQKIKFAGIDFEGRFEGTHIKKVFSIILQKRTGQTDSLTLLLQACINAEVATLDKNLKQLASFLYDHWELRKNLSCYSDLLLISSAPYGMQRSRDKAIFNQFLILYDELLRNPDKFPDLPKFFASFGTGHINPKNNRNIASLLQSDESPIKNKVSVTGVQYLNCSFSKENVYKKSDGILSFLCKKKEIEKTIGKALSGKPTLRFLPIGPGSYCDPAIKELNGMIVIENFPASHHYIWE